MGLNNRTRVGLALLTLARLGLPRLSFALLGLAMMGLARVGTGGLESPRLGSAMLCYRPRHFWVRKVLYSFRECFAIALLHRCVALSLLCFIVALLHSLCNFASFASFSFVEL